jgi:hypothetical protein
MVTDTFNFLGLPVELMCEISTYLTTKDLGNLRRNCKTVESVFFDQFAAEFFTIRQIFFHPISLLNLIEISRHPQFSKRVQKIIFCDDRVVCLNDTVLFAEDLQTAQTFGIESGEFAHLLASALQNFPNCKIIEERDFISHNGRLRDGTDWRSYGVRTLMSTGNVHITPEEWRRDPHEVSCTPGLINAIVNATKGGFHLESLQCINHHNAWPWKHLYVPDHRKADYQHAFRHLTTLFLCLQVPNREARPSFFRKLSSFLGMIFRLQHLRINMVDKGNRPMRGLLDFLVSIQLRRLELGGFNLTFDEIKDFLQAPARKNLEYLTFWRTSLNMPDYGQSPPTTYWLLGRRSWNCVKDSIH